MICHKTKTIFTHIPKTAGTSVEIMFEAVKHDKENSTFHETCQGKHMMCRNYKDLFPEEFENYYKWSVVRNSWEKEYSFYAMYKINCELARKVEPMTFKDFLKNNVIHHWRRSVKYRKNKPQKLFRNQWHSAIIHADQLDFISIDDEIVVDKIVQYKDLNTEWKKICKKIKKKYEPLILTRNVPKQPIQEVYDQETIDFVAKIRKRDIEYFKYELPFKVN